MFENVNGLEHAINAGNSQSNDRNDRKPMRQDRKDFTSGVVGVGMNKQGSYDDPGMDMLDDIEDVSGRVFVYSCEWNIFGCLGY